MAQTKPLGTICNLGSYDTDATVEVGDVVESRSRVTHEPLSRYRVIEARRVSERSAHHPYRHNLVCVRIAPEDVGPEDVVHPLYWHPRGRKSR